MQTLFSGTVVVYGGETKLHSIAQRDSWTRMLQFLGQRLTMDHPQNELIVDGPPAILPLLTSKL